MHWREIIEQPFALLRVRGERSLDDVDAFKLPFALALTPHKAEHLESALPGEVGSGVYFGVEQPAFPIACNSASAASTGASSSRRLRL